MQVQLYSQLLRLDLSNDHLLQMYYVLYYDLPPEEREMTRNLAQLITLREKIKLDLRKLLFNLRNSRQVSRIGGAVLNFLPVFLKLDFLARNTFKGSDLKSCFEREIQNVKQYYETLYNQNIPDSAIDILLDQKRKLESLP